MPRIILGLLLFLAFILAACSEDEAVSVASEETLEAQAPIMPYNIRLEIRTNKAYVHQAASAPVLPVGGKVTWSYRLMNIGYRTLKDVVVTDSQQGEVCRFNELRPFRREACTLEGVVTEGLYSGSATVTAVAEGKAITDTGQTYYRGQAGVVPPNTEQAPNPSTPESVAPDHQDQDSTPPAGEIPVTEDNETSDEETASPETPTPDEETIQPEEENREPGTPAESEGETPKPNNPEATGAVEGVIWLDDNQDGIRTAGEGPLSGVKVQLANALGDAVAHGSTNERGVYAFADIPVGQYQIRVHLPGGLALSPKFQGDAAGLVVSEVATLTGLSDIVSVLENTVGRVNAGAYRLQPSVGVTVTVNGQPLEDAPTFTEGQSLTVSYEVRNLGDVVLREVQVRDGSEALVCPKDSLDLRSAMTCMRTVAARAGTQSMRVTVSAIPVQHNGTTLALITQSYSGQYSVLAQNKPEKPQPQEPEQPEQPEPEQPGPEQSEQPEPEQSGPEQPEQPESEQPEQPESEQPEQPEQPEPGPEQPAVIPEPHLIASTTVNGLAANETPGPTFKEGDILRLSYILENAGNTVLANITVQDNITAVEFCTGGTLNPGDRYMCEVEVTAYLGLQRKMMRVTATPTLANGDTLESLTVFAQANYHVEPTPQEPEQPNPQTPETEEPEQPEQPNPQTPETEEPEQPEQPNPQTPETEEPEQPNPQTPEPEEPEEPEQPNPQTPEPEEPEEPEEPAFTPAPSLHALVTVNGLAASEAPGPEIEVKPEERVSLSYRFTNRGNTVLDKVTITSHATGAELCVLSRPLQMQDSYTCTMEIRAVEGAHREAVSVTTTPVLPSGEAIAPITATATAYYSVALAFEPAPNLSASSTITSLAASEAPGPTIEVRGGEAVTLSYTLMNTGNTTLNGVKVQDSATGEMLCPERTLNPRDQYICDIEKELSEGTYYETANVSATPLLPNGDTLAPLTVLAEAHFTVKVAFEPESKLTVSATVNDLGATTPPGPTFESGEALTLKYTFENAGNTVLDDISVQHAITGAELCQGQRLQPGDGYTCTGNIIAVEGTHRERVRVTATPKLPNGEATDVITAFAEANYVVNSKASANLMVKVELREPETPEAIFAGEAFTLRYNITNTGNRVIENIKVRDSQNGGLIACNYERLEPFQGYYCDLNMLAGLGEQTLEVSVSGEAIDAGDDASVNAQDTFNYTGHEPLRSDMTVRVTIEGFGEAQVTQSPGPKLTTPTATLIYSITNTGNTRLMTITAASSLGSATCEAVELAPNQSTTCRQTFNVVEGTQSLRGGALAQGVDEEGEKVGQPVTKTAFAYYVGDLPNAGGDSETVETGPPANSSEGCIQGHLWHDFNSNGIQDDGAELNLSSLPQVIAGNVVTFQFMAAQTDSKGNYRFCGSPGNYVLLIEVPEGYQLATQNVGNDDKKDSDFELGNYNGTVRGVSDSISVVAGQTITGVDMGLAPINTEGNPGSGEQNLKDFEQRSLDAVNKARSQARNCGGKHFKATGPLVWNDLLARAAKAHSEDMNRMKIITHTGSDGNLVDFRVKREGYRPLLAGENVAAGRFTPEGAVDYWLTSPSHCANIMDPRLKELGVAYTNIYWAQVFGIPF